MEDRDTQLLSRAAANHLFLAQFEPLRATLLTLRSRNPSLARAILQTIVARGGRFESILWSNSCPSPALLTHLAVLELVEFDNPTYPLWSFDADSLRFRAEFLLLVHTVASKVSESQSDFGSNGVLDRVLELGFRRLRPDVVATEEGPSEGVELELEEGELMGLRGVIVENADIFDMLCGNIQQLVGWQPELDQSGLAITLRREGEGKGREEGVEVLRLVQRAIQNVHLDTMKECLINGDVDGAVSHIRFLHLEYGVEEAEYRYV
ncbi:hypothetical protein RJ639_041196 [Escallonia herrerae]|uniref:Uncharacterized protein n=1 Tax=Escallonia herrerae TaxID=1293975 RepID=A0AA88WFS1_9ASTE|nr:hypothetical protein RJ639_041196 [Escallonia herrerae]